MESDFVFIGGVGRSGTSIAREMLATNSEVASLPFEYRFIIDPDGIVDYVSGVTKSWSPYLADKRLKRLENLLIRLGRKRTVAFMLGELVRSNKTLKRYITADTYHGWELQEHFPNYYIHVEKLISELEDFKFHANWVGAESFQLDYQVKYASPKSADEIYAIFSGFFASLFGDLLSKQGKRTFVEDNTWNLLFIDQLSGLFRNAKFIHVYRDPRDVVCSYCKQRWMPADLVQSATICRDLYQQISEKLSNYSGDKVLSISLEKLVCSQEEVVHQIAAFSGVSVNPSMLEFSLSNSSVGRWKKDLSGDQVATIKPILKDTIEMLGYVW